MDATCKTCPFFEIGAASTLADGRPRGLCHHAAAEPSAENPERYAHWWCSEHPLRQRDRLAAMAMQGLATRDRFYRAASAPRIVASWAYEIADEMLALAASRPPGTPGTDEAPREEGT